MPATAGHRLHLIGIQYKIPYFLYLRIKAYAQANGMNMTHACVYLLTYALQKKGVTDDPRELLGQTEEPGG